MSLTGLVTTAWTACPAPGATVWAVCAVPPNTVWTEEGGVGPPTIASLLPRAAEQSQVIHATIRGTNFVPGAVVAVSGALVTVSNAVIVDGDTITCDLTVALAALIGARTLTVTTPAGSASTGFTVTTAFSPIPTTGLMVWVEADYGFGAYADQQRVTGATNRGGAGDLVIPSANPGGLLGPKYRTASFGGKPCLDYGGIEGLETPAGLHMTSFATFVVGLMWGGTTMHAVWEFVDYVGAGASASVLWYVAPSIYTSRAAFPNDSAYDVNAPGLARDGRKLWRHRFVDTHASHQIFENGAQLACTTRQSVDPGGGVSSAGSIRLGCGGAGSPKLTGSIAAFLVYSPIPSAGDITAIEAYLTGRWPLQ